jgi:flagellar hook-associated protein 2
MGTVGLSFGNPTGGSGFDVSTTVSEIVANLQNVETPWKNQLSALSAEDAAFTTIGNDVSTLSNALSSLTAFEGALASKQGQSSDTSVLALSSASPETVAGNHSVTVVSLASTSSWSSSTVAANDTLTGSFTIQVGPTGTPQTIALPGQGETLSQLAAQINTAGIGVTANVLTNSTGSFLSLVSATSGAAGNLSVGTGVTDAGAAVSFTSKTAGSDAALVVDGNTITSGSNTVTDAIPGVTFQILEASTNAVSVQITNNTGDIESAIGGFISAYNQVVQDLNTQEGDDASGNPEPLFGNSSLALLQEQLGNAFNQVQTGVWDSSGTPLAAGHSNDTLNGSITITTGTATATFPPSGSSGPATLASLVNQINGDSSLGVTASIATNADGGSFLKLVSATRGTAGDFTVTGNLTDATGSISGDSGAGASISFTQTATGSATDSFGLLGIGITDNGSLTADASTLNSVLNDDFQSVVNFFQEASGVGEVFSNLLTGIGNVASTGVIKEALASDSQQEDTLNADITSENAIISTQQASITAELEQANNTLQAIPTQISEINQLFEAITGQSSGANQN